MSEKSDGTCIYFRGIEDCLCNNDPDDPGECIYENGIEPLNPELTCKYYETLKKQSQASTQM